MINVHSSGEESRVALKTVETVVVGGKCVHVSFEDLEYPRFR